MVLYCVVRFPYDQVVQNMISENQQNDEDAMCHAFDYDSTQFQCVEFEYDLDENGHKKILGKGTPV